MITELLKCVCFFCKESLDKEKMSLVWVSGEGDVFLCDRCSDSYYKEVINDSR